MGAGRGAAKVTSEHRPRGSKSQLLGHLEESVPNKGAGRCRGPKQEMPSLFEEQQEGKSGWSQVNEGKSSKQYGHRSKARPDRVGLHFQYGSRQLHEAAEHVKCT